MDENLSNPNWTDLARERACLAGSFIGFAAFARFLVQLKKGLPWRNVLIHCETLCE